MLIYMDHAATAPVRDEVIEGVLEVGYGNPSAMYGLGREAKAAMEEARECVAQALAAQPREISFTSGGTEANNWAILAAARARKAAGRHIVTTSIEHHSVLHSYRQLEREGFEVTYLPVDGKGFLEVGTLREALRPDTILISLMMANNEVGSIQPVAEVARIGRARGILVHTDAVQAFGHVCVDVNALGVDMLSISGHKFGALKGVGALYVSQNTKIPNLIHGGAQERGRRAGTENTWGIASMGIAARLAASELGDVHRVEAMREALWQEILRCTEGKALRNSPADNCLPGILNVSFPGIESESLLLLLDAEGLCASSGAACASGSAEVSHVLEAMGMPRPRAKSSIRLSLGHTTHPSQVPLAAGIIRKALYGR